MSSHQFSTLSTAVISTADSASDTTFSFSGLPLELQFKILYYTYTPRSIIINQNFALGTTPRSKTTTPVSLQINHVLRTEALRHYELLRFKKPEGLSREINFDRWPRVYVNFETDTISVDAWAPRSSTRTIDSWNATYWNSISCSPINAAFLLFVTFIAESQRSRLSLLLGNLHWSRPPPGWFSFVSAHDKILRSLTRLLTDRDVSSGKVVCSLPQGNSFFEGAENIKLLVEKLDQHEIMMSQFTYRITGVGEFAKGTCFVFQTR